MVRLVGLVVVGRAGVVMIVVVVAVRRVLVPREAVAAATAPAAQRVGHARHLHVGRRLRRRVRLHVGESGGVYARVLRAVLRAREPAVPAVRAARRAGRRSRWQREPVGAAVGRGRALRPAPAIRVLRVRPRLRGWRRRLARGRVRQRPYLRLRRRNRHAAVAGAPLRLFFYAVTEHLVVHALQHILTLPLLICKDKRIHRSYFTSDRQ